MNNSLATNYIIKAVIFDHDGTLVNSEPVHLRSWSTVLQPLGHVLSDDEYQRNLSGVASIVSANWLADKFNLDMNADALLSAKQKLIGEFLTNSPYPLMSGATALLEFLRGRGVKIGLASGAGRHEVEHSVKNHNLLHYFAAVSTKDDVTHNKPAPDVYLRTAAMLDVAPEECLAIEDSDSGEQAALAANMRCLRLHPNACDGHGQLLRFATLGKIQTWLEKILVPTAI